MAEASKTLSIPASLQPGPPSLLSSPVGSEAVACWDQLCPTLKEAVDASGPGLSLGA